MIILPATGATLRTSRYLHHKSTVRATSYFADESAECCLCSCDTVIPVLANLSDQTNKFENDIFSWVYKIPDGCTVTATLTDTDTGTDYVLNSNTYGLYYSTGTLKANVWGLVVSWVKVADSIGFGNYEVNIVIENATPTEIFNKTWKFNLMPYSCESAHGTVRIESVNTGYIEGGFDYRNISVDNVFSTSAKKSKGWIQQVRYYGQLDVSALPVEIDNLSDQNRNLLQVQTKISNEYNLRLEFIKTDLSNQVIYDNLLSDYLLLCDYNADNVDTYRDVKVSLLSVETPEKFRNKTQLINIKFVDYKQNLLKRYF